MARGGATSGGASATEAARSGRRSSARPARRTRRWVTRKPVRWRVWPARDGRSCSGRLEARHNQRWAGGCEVAAARARAEVPQRPARGWADVRRRAQGRLHGEDRVLKKKKKLTGGLQGRISCMALFVEPWCVGHKTTGCLLVFFGT
ncbi:hypothetical protein PVAP13_5NG232724 [Panicum virgatum]|uniref:Uncharacterized protein n=1 Tax=Panicum virgatum TaxID=38727 RepID=A0A8T0RUD3_PANVG|nr:hypothetical protein PVAP13_5NG232724 [Panicum virgatum]